MPQAAVQCSGEVLAQLTELNNQARALQKNKAKEIAEKCVLKSTQNDRLRVLVKKYKNRVTKVVENDIEVLKVVPPPGPDTVWEKVKTAPGPAPKTYSEAFEQFVEGTYIYR